MGQAGGSRWVTLAAVVAACIGLGSTALFMWKASTPADASPEAGFARDMATHHAQAAEMSFVIRDVSTDEALRSLAYDIIVTQSAQRGIFMGWLQQWGLSQASSQPRMAWMGHVHPAGSAGDMGVMPGMASATELAELRQAKGKDAEILFLQLMIRHHQGGVEMARSVLARSNRQEVLTMARSIEQGQTAEIALMTEMLARRGARP